MNDRDEKQTEQAVREILGRTRGYPLDPSPYLKTRVLARLRERQAESRSFWTIRAWKRYLALAGSAIAITGIALPFLMTGEKVFQAQTTQPVAVRLDMKDLKKTQISHAMVVLPSGVKFYSARFPEIREKSMLRLELKSMQDQAALPIVVQGIESGTKSVQVRFFDGNRMVAERNVRIKFNDKSRSELLTEGSCV